MLQRYIGLKYSDNSVSTQDCETRTPPAPAKCTVAWNPAASLVISEVITIKALTLFEHLELVELLLRKSEPTLIIQLKASSKREELSQVAHRHGLTIREFKQRLKATLKIASHVLNHKTIPDIYDQLEAQEAGLSYATIHAVINVSAIAATYLQSFTEPTENLSPSTTFE